MVVKGAPDSLEAVNVEIALPAANPLTFDMRANVRGAFWVTGRILTELIVMVLPEAGVTVNEM
jgi:hypothetical protein